MKETEGSETYTACLAHPLSEESPASVTSPTLQPRRYLPARSRQGHCGVGVTLPVHDGEALALADAEERSGGQEGA